MSKQTCPGTDDPALIAFRSHLDRCAEVIRRPDVQDRHIWVFDTRIWNNTGFGLPRLSRAAQALLSNYKNQVADIN